MGKKRPKHWKSHISSTDKKLFAVLCLSISLATSAICLRHYYLSTTQRSIYLRANITLESLARYRDTSRKGFASRVVQLPIPEAELKNRRLVIYNRVPKCGSTTMTTLIKKLSHSLSYNLTNNNTFRPSLKVPEQAEFVRRMGWMEKLIRPMAYISHVYVVEFHRFNSAKPIYINLIREPLERFASHFYCCYNPRRKGKPGMTLEECVENGNRLCGSPTSSRWTLTLRYFCGHDPICRINSRNALALALYNVDRYYTAVGYLENLAQFIELLERLVPQFFTGVSEMFKVHPPKQNANRDPRKNSTLSFSTEQILKKHLGLEYELYYFIKERFHKQHSAYLKSIG